MPAYAMICRNEHRFDVDGRMANPPRAATCECGEPARRDYQSEAKQVGFIDGPSTGYFPDAMGFPNAGDPRHPTLKVCPSKRAWINAKKDRWGDAA